MAKRTSIDRVGDDILGDFGTSLVSIADRLKKLGTTGSERFIPRKLSLSVTLEVGSAEIEGSFAYRFGGARSLELELDSTIVEALRVTRPTYENLSSKYSCDKHSCSMTIENTCAVRLSEALIALNEGWVPIFKASGKNLCDEKFVRGAQDLAGILSSASGFGVYDFGIDDPNGTVPNAMKDKQGIVIYMDIPSFPDGQGHIGLWNKTNGQCGESYWMAKRVWFWKLS